MKKIILAVLLTLTSFLNLTLADEPSVPADQMSSMTFRLNSDLSEANILQNHFYIDPNPGHTTLKAWFIDGKRHDSRPVIEMALGFTYCELTLELPTDKLKNLTLETNYILNTATWSKKSHFGIVSQAKFPLQIQNDGFDGEGSLHCVAGVGTSELEVKNVLFNLGQEVTILR